jgi:hypothetical protein
MNVQPSEVNGSGSSPLDNQVTTQERSTTSPLSSRAREILDSLKEQRESLLGKWNDGGEKTSPRMRPTAAGSSAPFIRSSAIQKLQATLQQERLSRLRKQQRFLPVSPGTTNSGSCSVDGSDTGKGSVGTRSTETEETLSFTTFSAPVSPTTQSVDDAALLNKSIRIPNVGASGGSMCKDATDSTIPVSMLSSRVYPRGQSNALLATEINEEPAPPDTKGIPTMDPVEQAIGLSSIPMMPSRPPNFDAISKPASNQQARNMSLDDVEVPLELSPIDTRSKQRLSSDRVLVSPSADDALIQQNTDSPRLCPGSECSAPPSTTLSLKSTAERKAYIEQLYQNQGALTTISRRKPRSTAVRASSGLRQQERNHVNRVLVRGRVAILKPSNLRIFVPESDKGANLGVRSSSERGRHYEMSDQSACQNGSTSSNPENKEATSTVIRKNEEDSQVSSGAKATAADICSDSALRRPASSLESWLKGEVSERDAGYQLQSCDDTSLDETVTTRRRERLALIRHLEEDVAKSAVANNPSSHGNEASCTSSKMSASLGSIVISDDSSCDLTTSSESSDWASSVGESTNLLANNSIADTHSIVSCVTMPPLSPLSPPSAPCKRAGSARRQVVVAWKEPLLSEMRSPSLHEEKRSPSLDEESQQHKSISSKPSPENDLKSSSNLFVAGRAADSLCFANGGHFMIATKSGMTLHHHTKLRLTWLNQRPTTVKKVCLSTDLRCGTRGSLYDIAVRSGCNARDPYLFNRSQQRAASVDTNTAFRDSAGNAHLVSNIRGRSTKTEDYLTARGGTSGAVKLSESNTCQQMPFTVATNRVKPSSKNCLGAPGRHCSPTRGSQSIHREMPSIQDPDYCVD